MKARWAVAALAVLALAGCADDPAVPSYGPDTAAAEYCTAKGGEVQARQPTYGTNNDESAWVQLRDSIETCKLATTGDGTAIFIDTKTLYSTKPTLAALAYLQSSTPDDLRPSGNPAAAICSDLGGTSSYGPGANGGGLVYTGDSDFQVFAPCMFADGSFIEEWGIAYHQEGTIRGADLEPLFRFDVADAPHIYD